MPANGPYQDLPSPLLSEPPDGPAQIAAANAAIGERLNMRFASVAALDAAIPNPVDGMEVFIGSGSGATKHIRWNGGWHTIYQDQRWIYPDLLNGWTNYGSGYAPARYRFEDGGRSVRIEGHIKGGSLVTECFILPDSYTPPGHVPQAVVTGTGYGRLDITGSGRVIPREGDASFFSLAATFGIG